MNLARRLKIAARMSALHFAASAVVAAAFAALVFSVWYPYPYREFSGGRELFLLLVGVDLVCGPLLTLVLFNNAKPRAELLRDLLLVVLIQFAALGYGVFTVWKARPLFLVMEIDRFKVIALPDLQNPAAEAALNADAAPFTPKFFNSPVVVAIRLPKNEDERKTVMMDSIVGGRDYSVRPEFYIPYEGDAARKSLARAKPLAVFLNKQPDQRAKAAAIAAEKHADLTRWLYVPVIARQDWVAVLDKQGQIQGFLKGDGF